MIEANEPVFNISSLVIIVEFYREFWGKVNFFIIDVLNKSYDEKLRSFSQQSSVLSLLFKKEDPLVLDNYRPISLLNVCPF
jgi:hypothetical protein